MPAIIASGRTIAASRTRALEIQEAADHPAGGKERVVGLKGRSILSIADLSSDEIERLLNRAALLKAEWHSGGNPPLLAGKTLALIFEKPSLRTRVTFEAGMSQLGGHAIYLAGADIQLGVRESVPDIARNLSRWVEAISARTFAHSTVAQLAENASIPVINALSDLEHPCQALADLLTIREKKGRLEGLTLAYVGDGNNVCHSLLLASAKMGMNMAVAHPEGYAPDLGIVAAAEMAAAREGARVTLTTDAREAVSQADVVYTDVWTSMGQESEKTAREAVFRPYQVNAALLNAAKGDAIVLHCLPAHRGEEITADVLDGAQSVVLDEAENRLHAQKALLLELIGG
jgi:ornithine carbamoyltransferase